jgi:hypothetical protein
MEVGMFLYIKFIETREYVVGELAPLADVKVASSSTLPLRCQNNCIYTPLPARMLLGARLEFN